MRRRTPVLLLLWRLAAIALVVVVLLSRKHGGMRRPELDVTSKWRAEGSTAICIP